MKMLGWGWSLLTQGQEGEELLSEATERLLPPVILIL